MVCWMVLLGVICKFCRICRLGVVQQSWICKKVFLVIYLFGVFVEGIDEVVGDYVEDWFDYFFQDVVGKFIFYVEFDFVGIFVQWFEGLVVFEMFEWVFYQVYGYVGWVYVGVLGVEGLFEVVIIDFDFGCEVVIIVFGNFDIVILGQEFRVIFNFVDQVEYLFCVIVDQDGFVYDCY